MLGAVFFTVAGALVRRISIPEAVAAEELPGPQTLGPGLDQGNPVTAGNAAPVPDAGQAKEEAARGAVPVAVPLPVADAGQAREEEEEGKSDQLRVLELEGQC